MPYKDDADKAKWARNDYRNDPEPYKKAKKKWADKNKDKTKARARAYRSEQREKLTEYKRTLFCEHCGMSFKDCPYVCDFHHRDPAAKRDNISNLNTFPAMMREIKKCSALCSNCHRIQHHRESFSE